METAMTTRGALAALLLTITLPASAALPAEVQGQALPSLAPLIRDVNPAVVNIQVNYSRTVRGFFGRPQRQEAQGGGSGVIVDAGDGLILTNHHVVAGADEVLVTLEDQRQFEATVIGSDEATDVALIRIEAEDLDQMPLGDSDQLAVGDFVVAIGNPFGFNHTVTSGIVSAKGRQGLDRDSYEDFIQTDAAINPGNSGGALVNLRGELVGINSAIISPRGTGSIGIGFAIPVNMAHTIMDQLLEFGDVRRGVLGINIQNLSPDLAEEFGVPANQGAIITRVQPGSAADEAGIEVEDIVVAVDGEPVRGAGDLRNKVGLHRAGEPLALAILRDGERLELQAMIADPDARRARPVAEGDAGPLLAGAQFEELDADLAEELGTDGVVITRLDNDSALAREGLRAGDVITSVNREPVRTIEELEAAAAGSSRMLLNVRRGDGALFVVVRAESARPGRDDDDDGGSGSLRDKG